jgi:hypothetical protein
VDDCIGPESAGDEDWDGFWEGYDLGCREGSEQTAGTQTGEGPTPGERLLYALGQLYRRSRYGDLDVDPDDFDIEDLARIIGVWRDVEFVQDDEGGRSYHFPSEVLCVAPGFVFPWYLLDIWAWAAERELGDFQTRGGE